MVSSPNIFQRGFLWVFLMSALVSNARGDDQAASLTTSSGTLSILQACDFENHRTERLYFLRETPDRESIRLRFEGAPPAHLHQGAFVRIMGRRNADEIVLPAGTEGVQTLNAAAPAEVAASIVAGEQKTVVLLINFTDATLECSAAAISGLMFTNSLSVDGLYRETSYTNVFFSGSVFGPYTINYSKTGSCNPDAWASAVEAAATAAGVNLSQFNRKVYVFPGGTSCGWAGLGTIGGNPSKAWIATCNLADVYAHELGHNLGMHHASTDTNNDDVSDCEYCDTSDFMGYGGVGFRQIDAAHKDQMGWTPAGKIVTTATSGSFNIAPLELLPGGTSAPQILKIAKAGTAEFYYISYRRALGYDTTMPSQYADKIQVHHYRTGVSEQTFFVQTLIDGGQFTDATTGFTLTQISHNNNSASVQVTFNNCSPATPTASLAPATQSGNPGTTLTYTLNLKNNDSALCPSTTFLLSRAVAAGWTSTLSPASVTLPPGQTGTATLTVASAASATAGNFPVTVSVSDGVNNTHNTSAAATYSVTVPASCTPAAPTLTMTPLQQNGDGGVTLTYTVNLTNHDSATCSATTFQLNLTAPAGWPASVVPTTLTLSPVQSGSATVSVTLPTTVLAGSYPITVNVTGGAEPLHSISAGASYITGLDTEPPTAPTNLTAVVKSGLVHLNWSGAIDNVRVTFYQIWRDGVNVGSTKTRRYRDKTASPGATHTYYIVAADAAGNMSSSSPTAAAIVPAALPAYSRND